MIAIVTDSTSYLTGEEADNLGIRMVPMSYSVAGNSYIEGFAGENGEYVNLIKSGSKAVTSQVSVAAFTSTFEELLRKGYDVFCLVISSRLSGTYSSASRAAREFKTDKIIVVDSHTSAGGLHILLERASLLVKSGISLKKMAEKVEAMRGCVELGFTVNDINTLRRSGRMGIVRRSQSTILNIRPILNLSHGSIVSMGIARGVPEQCRRLIDMINVPTDRIEIIHTHNQDMALKLYNMVKKSHSDAVVTIRELGPVLSIHVGFGLAGLAWYRCGE